MKVFAGNITPDTEDHIGMVLGGVLSGAVDDDTDYDDVLIEAKFNIGDGCFSAEGKHTLTIGDRFGNPVDFIATANEVWDEEGNIDLKNLKELRYVIERSTEEGW